MIFKPFPLLQTQRLILREPQIADWPVVSHLRTDSYINRFVKRSSAETEEKAKEFIENALANMAKDELVNWFICLKEDPKMIGSICLWNISADRKTAEIGYDLDAPFWGKGIMDEAMQAVINYGFDILKLDNIEAYTSYGNSASLGLLRKNGFKLNKEKTDADNPDNRIFELIRF
ncbi:ribosomal-protein-alanine N-acetyltransferase [Christiangramia gaetbulicola]|uniref:Ribosomal-protein-alanine N-acetyltransferase n=1 Tax=Christiangramia gaetbulicola TaxID=703340 RepID=A0A2T6AI72_9FLAO|nr:GNAT family N-acetyltransferase [Christiangramia gaetbulicola]PTX43513.1 ribosomal-protein-alanine N-acetyltransferase [Christiangramia gaetbulicola]